MKETPQRLANTLHGKMSGPRSPKENHDSVKHWGPVASLLGTISQNREEATDIPGGSFLRHLSWNVGNQKDYRLLEHKLII